MVKRDYYEVLEITRTSSNDEIKKAYRKLAIKFHPDKNPGDTAAEDRFKEAAEAYEVLSNAEKRSRYDRFGHQGVGGAGGHSHMSTEDIYEQFGDVFSGFESFFGGSRRGGTRKAHRGSNLRVRMKLTLEEISKGVKKKLKLKRQTTCSKCQGTGAEGSGDAATCSTCKGAGKLKQMTDTFIGRMQVDVTCPQCQGEGSVIKNRCKKCNGDGRELKEDVIEVDIPAGVIGGMQLNMQGGGNAAPRRGIPGDLIIAIEEEPHEVLQREGTDVLYHLPISIPDAALGTTVEVPTLDGLVSIQIQPGTQPNKVLKLRDKGIPDIDSKRRGDQLVIVNVTIPTKLTEKEKKALEMFRASDNFTAVDDKDQRSFFSKIKEVFSH